MALYSELSWPQLGAGLTTKFNGGCCHGSVGSGVDGVRHADAVDGRGKRFWHKGGKLDLKYLVQAITSEGER